MAVSHVRDDLIKSGLDVLKHSGYAGTGVQAILSASGAPRGSFYNYFTSKEDFFIVAIEHAYRENEATFRRHLGRSGVRPLSRLKAYFKEEIGLFEDERWSGGCLLGTIGQETADQGGALRKLVQRLFEEWRQLIEGCLREAQETGNLGGGHDLAELSGYILGSWQGALLRMKVDKSPAPLHAFLRVTFTCVLTADRIMS